MDSQDEMNYTSGLAHHVAGNYQDAVDFFDSVLENTGDPRLYAKTLCAKAETLTVGENYWDSLETFQEVSKRYRTREDNGLTPADKADLKERAEIGFADLGHRAMKENIHALCAESSTELLLSCDSDSPYRQPAARALGDAAANLAAAGEKDEGIKHLKRLAQENGWQAVAQRHIGEVEASRGNLKEAADAYHQASIGESNAIDASYAKEKISVTGDQALNNRDFESASRCYRVVGRYTRGEQDFQSSLSEKLQQCGHDLYDEQNYSGASCRFCQASDSCIVER